MRRLALLTLCVIAAIGVRPVSATWSIVLTDSDTGEIAVGTVTCLNQFDLLAVVPVIAVNQGGGVVQAAGDFGGLRRPVIFNLLMLDKTPEIILETLSTLGGHEARQYGIVDTVGGRVSFTGNENGAWAGGVADSAGSLHYAIQGNVLAGPCVLDAIVAAVLETPGDIPAKLMAGMEAARSQGGDGRCSCTPNDPTGCGCPPPDFVKSGHIGGLVVARIGDTDDDVCDAGGCVDGDYFMRLNVAFQANETEDPVFQLQTQFDAWRAAHVGRPDAVHSLVTFDPPVPPANGAGTTTMIVTLLDWQDQPITTDIATFNVVHGVTSDHGSTIGGFQPGLEPGTYEVTLTNAAAPVVDRFVVTVDDGIRRVTLMPEATLEYYTLGDIDGSGTVAFADLLEILSAWGPCSTSCPLDLDADGTVGPGDLEIVVRNWG